MLCGAVRGGVKPGAIPEPGFSLPQLAKEAIVLAGGLGGILLRVSAWGPGGAGLCLGSFKTSHAWGC